MDPQFLNQLLQIAGRLEAGLSQELTQLGLQLCSTLNNPAAFQATFRQLWVIALSRVRDAQLLRLLQPMLRPGLGLLGAGWAEIEMAALAVVGATMSEILMGIALALVAAVLVCLLLLLLIALCQGLRKAMGWVPPWAQTPQPTQTPHWNNLLNYVKQPPCGPVYALENRTMPALG